MTLLDERPGSVSGQVDSFLPDADVLVGEMVSGITFPAAVPAARELFGEVTRIYRAVLDERRVVTHLQRAGIRSAGHAFVNAGGSPDVAADLLGRLASQVINRVAAVQPERVAFVMDLAHTLVREFLVGVTEPQQVPLPASEMRQSAVQRLVLGGQVPPEIEDMLEACYVVAVLRFVQPVPRERISALLKDHGVNGVLSAPVDEGVILLVPERCESLLARLPGECLTRLGQSPWLATAKRARADLASGYQEARDVLALVVATKQEPGCYCLDDVMVEYAVLNDPVVSRHLLSVIEPTLTHEILYETLEALIQGDFNRTTTAKALFIHRSTLDYRIRRIEEVTGYGPLTSRGAYILRMAVLAHTTLRVRQ